MNMLMKLRFEHVTARPNADGTTRYYFRRRGDPLIRLPDDPHSPEFAEAYQQALKGPRASDEGSFAWLCDQYIDSAAFSTKSKATQDARRRVIASMTAEPINPAHPQRFAVVRLSGFTRAHVEVLRDRKRDFPNAANHRLKVLAQIFKLAVARGWIDANPVRDVERLSIPRGGHETATDEQIAAYFQHHREGPAWLAMTILTETGVRVSDLRLLGAQHVRDGILRFHCVKTGALCEIPVSERLRAAVASLNRMTWLESDHGRPFRSDKAMSARMSKWFRQAGIEGVTAHGVRKWLATRMANNGANELELCAWFGWRDSKEARPYIEKANRARLAISAASKIANV